MRSQYKRTTGVALSFMVVCLTAIAHEDQSDDRNMVEPGAGQWRTWVISSGKDYRVPPPPGRAASGAELRALADLIRQNDAQARQQITFWDAGAPVYQLDGSDQSASLGRQRDPRVISLGPNYFEDCRAN